MRAFYVQPKGSMVVCFGLLNLVSVAIGLPGAKLSLDILVASCAMAQIVQAPGLCCQGGMLGMVVGTTIPE